MRRGNPAAAVGRLGGVAPDDGHGAGAELRPGRLADIAPTILDVMGLAQPEEMDGKTLIVR